MGTRNLMALVKQRSILPLPPLMRMTPCCNRFMSSGYTNQSESRSQKQQISNKESIGDAKIRILVKSFSQKYLNHPCFQSYRKVGLPRRRVVYTVLRSPHIDKKSREQFEIRVHKQLLEKDVDVNEMAKMFFWFKRMHFFGAQYEFIFNYKTRLDMSRGKFQCISTKPIIKKLDISNINCVLQAAPFKGIQVPKRIDVMIGTF